MIGLGLSVVQIAVRQLLGFDPKSLFAASEPGVWYDPSDMSTMFQDSSGTTPVTAVEQPVGLMLDKSKGLVLGSDQSPVAYGATAGVVITETTVTVPAALGTFTYVTPSPTIPLTDNSTYLITYEVTRSAGSVEIYLRGNPVPISTTQTATRYAFAGSSASGLRIGIGSTFVGSIKILSVRELPGNHATQTTSTSRPVLSARYNLLTKTEQFDDAVWLKQRSNVLNNTTTAPDGTTSADTLVEDTNSNTHYLIPLAGETTFPVGAYTHSVYAKQASGNRRLSLNQTFGGVNGFAIFDLSSGAVASTSGAVIAAISNAGNGWYRCSITYTTTSTTARFDIALNAGGNAGLESYVGDGTSGIYIWGASLVPANQASLPYQRVNTATDYDADPSKFKPYLRFDGVDDWLVTPTITPGTDKAQVFAGVRKLSDPSLGQIAVELSDNASANAGAFFVAPTVASTFQYGFRSGGTIRPTVVSANLLAPTTNVLTGLGDISGDYAILRVNGTQVYSDTSDKGTGNFLAYPLYIGRRGGTILPFNGHLYGLIVRFGANLPAATIASTETWLNQRTGAY